MRRWAIGILVVAILGGGYAAWSHRRAERIKWQQGREAALRDTLFQMRKAIDAFHRDQHRYPRSLQELVPNYLRRIPRDPITGSADWRLTTEETVTPSQDFTAATATKSESVVVNVHSSAPGYANY